MASSSSSSRAIGSTSTTGAGRRGPPGVVLVPGLSHTAWSWAPVARRLAPRRRSSSRWTCAGTACPMRRPTATTWTLLAEDVVAVAEGSGAPRRRGRRWCWPGTGSGRRRGVGRGAARGALRRPRPRRRRLGGPRASTGLDVDEFLRGLDEPPEVLRSMAAWLADRAAFDPATWDADQERAARAAVVETAAGHVVPATRPHVVEAWSGRCSRTDPRRALAAVERAGRRARRRGRRDGRAARRSAACRAPRAPAGRRSACRFAPAGHNLMRYRPARSPPRSSTSPDDGRSGTARRAIGRCRSSTARPPRARHHPPDVLGVAGPGERGRRAGRADPRRRSRPTAASSSPARPSTARRRSPRSTTRACSASCGRLGRARRAGGHRARSSSPTRIRPRDVRGHVREAAARSCASRDAVGGRAGWWGLDTSTHSWPGPTTRRGPRSTSR